MLWLISCDGDSFVLLDKDILDVFFRYKIVKKKLSSYYTLDYDYLLQAVYQWSSLPGALMTGELR